MVEEPWDVRSFIAALEPAEREIVLRAGRAQRFAAGDLVLREGEPADAVLVVVVGAVDIVRVDADGHPHVWGRLGEGHLLGELAALCGDETRTASAVAASAVQARVLPRSSFFDLLGDTRFAVAVAQHLAQRLRAADQARVESSAPVTDRIARVLLREADDGLVVRRSQQWIAEQAGTSRETLVRVLARLRADGVLTTSRGRTTILRADVLQ